MQSWNFDQRLGQNRTGNPGQDRRAMGNREGNQRKEEVEEGWGTESQSVNWIASRPVVVIIITL